MASDTSGLTGTPFESPLCATPSPDEATTAATKGGFDLGDGGQKETPNQSGLPLLVTITDVKDGPPVGPVAVDITSPMPVAGNMAAKG